MITPYSAPFNPIAEQCPNPVYDEFLDGIDPDLQIIISKFAVKGVDIRVVNIESAREEGYPITDDMSDDEAIEIGDAYTAEVFETCDVDPNNSILVVRSKSDFYINISPAGVQDNFDQRNPDAYEKALDIYVDELTVGLPETYQDDAAVALEEIYALQYGEDEIIAEPEPVQQQAPQTEQTPTPTVAVEPKEPINIPVAPIAGGGLTLALTAGIALLGRNKVSVRRNRAEQLNVLKAHDSRATAAFVEQESDVTSLVALIPKEDTPELNELRDIVTAGYDSWESLQTRYHGSFANAVKGFRPTKKSVANVAEQYQIESAPYMEVVAAYEQSLAELRDKKERLPGKLSLAMTDLEYLEGRIQEITNPDDPTVKAYTVDSVQAEVARIREAYELATTLAEDENMVNKPYQLLGSVAGSAETIAQTLDSIPELHRLATEQSAVLKKSYTELVADQEKIKADQLLITENYDPSCLGELPSLVEDAANYLRDLKAETVKFGDPEAITSLDALLDLQSNVAEAARLQEAYTVAREQASDYVERLRTIETQAVTTIDQIDEDLDGAAEYIEKYADFIDDETEEVLFDLAHKVDAIRAAFAQPKPPYFELQKQLDDLKNRTLLGINQAKTEHQEMIDLETAIAEELKRYDRRLRALIDYESRNPDVDEQSEREIKALRKPSVTTRDSRMAMRSSLRKTEAALKILDEVKLDAESDVQQEADRKAAIQRRADEAKRAAARERQRAIDARNEANKRRADNSRRLATTRSNNARRTSSPSRSNNSRRV